MLIIDKIAALCEAANPAYIFYHEEADVLNIKIDGLSRGDSFVWADAVRTGTITKDRFGRKFETWNVQIYFSKFTDFGNDMRADPNPNGRVTSHGVKNDEIIEAIRTEIVYPFLRLLDTPNVQKDLNAGQEWTRIPVRRPPSRFDGNEISYLLELSVLMPICVSAPSPILYDLTYHIEGATPASITKTYPQGMRVTLETPEQLGMTLPENYEFLGWQIDGQTVQRVVMDSDKTVEGKIDGRTHFGYVLTPLTGFAPTINLTISGILTLRIHWGDGYEEDVTATGEFIHEHAPEMSEYKGWIEVISGNGTYALGRNAANACFFGATGATYQQRALLYCIMGANISNRMLTYTFGDARSLLYVKLSDNITYIDSYAFYNCLSINTLVIPKSVNTIAVGAFSTMPQCKWFEFKSIIPPSINSTAFSATLSSITRLFVPDDSLEVYKTTTIWVGWSDYEYQASQKPTK